jgi:hypothetical protein
MSILESHWLEEQRKDFITKENRPLRWGKATEWKKTRMNKEDKIQQLAKKIEQLTRELLELSQELEKPVVEVFADKLKQDERFTFLTSYGYDASFSCLYNACSDKDQALIDFHNVYRDTEDLTQQMNNQKILNRMWQLAYELNPKDWEPNFNIEFYKLFFDVTNRDTCEWVVEEVSQEILFSPGPFYFSKEAAQKAADDLNVKGYKL